MSRQLIGCHKRMHPSSPSFSNVLQVYFPTLCLCVCGAGVSQLFQGVPWEAEEEGGYGQNLMHEADKSCKEISPLPLDGFLHGNSFLLLAWAR